MCVAGYARVNAGVQSPEEGVGSPETRITGCCELPDMGLGTELKCSEAAGVLTATEPSLKLSGH